MQKIVRTALGVTLLAAWAAGCATSPPPERTGRAGTSSGYKVGIPYQIGDTWYYPHEQADYDETGIASWYGPTFYGKQTASGELFDGDGLTAAHRTLPMPVNVRVTNLDNGKSLVVRVNDRGPFAKGRIIDVSKHAAELLGFYAKGTARVRVTYLGRAGVPGGEPARDDTAPVLAKALRAVPAGRVETASLNVPGGARAAPTPVQVASATPPPVHVSSLAQPPVTGLDPTDDSDEQSDKVTTVPVPAVTHLYVQAGAFGSRDNAERLKQRLAAAELFISAADHEGKPLYRVRSGPYDDLETANAALAKLDELGNNDAQIVVDR
jgi:rare lipoprotein A